MPPKNHIHTTYSRIEELQQYQNEDSDLFEERYNALKKSLEEDLRKEKEECDAQVKENKALAEEYHRLIVARKSRTTSAAPSEEAIRESQAAEDDLSKFLGITRPIDYIQKNRADKAEADLKQAKERLGTMETKFEKLSIGVVAGTVDMEMKKKLVEETDSKKLIKATQPAWDHAMARVKEIIAYKRGVAVEDLEVPTFMSDARKRREEYQKQREEDKEDLYD